MIKSLDGDLFVVEPSPENLYDSVFFGQIEVYVKSSERFLRDNCDSRLFAQLN